MEEGRIQPTRAPLPKVVLDKRDKRFSFAYDLNVGDEGQLDSTLSIELIALEPDNENNERKVLELMIRKCKPIKLVGERIT